MNAIVDEAAATVEENNHQRPRNSQLTSFINKIINKNPDEDENNMIQRFKSTSIGKGVEHLKRTLTKNLFFKRFYQFMRQQRN